MPFKGPTLAAFWPTVIYHCAWCGDLDLLLPRSDFRKAKQLLISRGFRPRLDLSPSQEEAYLDATGEFVFDQDDPVTAIDLHTELLPRYFAFTMNPFTQPGEASALSFGGSTISTLAPEDTLLYLSAHGAKHRWELLGWICDLAELLRARTDMNWDRVLRTSRQLRADRMLNLGLVLAFDLLEAPVPAQVCGPARADSQARTLAAQVARRLCLPEHSCLNGWEGFLFHVRVRDAFCDKVRYPLLAAAIPPRLADRQTLALPHRLSFLYYLFRPIRLTVKYGRILVRKIQGESDF